MPIRVLCLIFTQALWRVVHAIGWESECSQCLFQSLVETVGDLFEENCVTNEKKTQTATIRRKELTHWTVISVCFSD